MPSALFSFGTCFAFSALDNQISPLHRYISFRADESRISIVDIIHPILNSVPSAFPSTPLDDIWNYIYKELDTPSP